MDRRKFLALMIPVVATSCIGFGGSSVTPYPVYSAQEVPGRGAENLGRAMSRHREVHRRFLKRARERRADRRRKRRARARRRRRSYAPQHRSLR